MNRTQFRFFETTSDGTPKEKPRVLGLNELPAAIALRCPHMKVKQLKHFIDLAVAAKGHPIDVTDWHNGALLFSARLEMCGTVDQEISRILHS